MGRDIFDRVTLVIPTCDRHFYLHRVLSYYCVQGFPIRVLVLDSSVQPVQDEGLLELLSNTRVCYRRLDHDTDIWSKIVTAARLVETPYYVLCADDDFITVKGIVQSASFLDEHSDYEVAQGYHVMFRIDEDRDGDERFCWCTHKWPEESNDSEDAESRLRFHFVNYQHTFYGVHRTDRVEEFHRDNIRLQIAPYLSEMLPSMLTAIRGKIKVLDVLYQVRELIPKKAARPANIGQWVRNGTYQEKYAPFRACLAMNLSKYAGVDLQRAGAIVDDSMFKYFAIYYRNLPSAMSAWRQRFRVAQIPWFDFRDAVGLSDSEYYADFDAIRRHALSFVPRLVLEGAC